MFEQSSINPIFPYKISATEEAEMSATETNDTGVVFLSIGLGFMITSSIVFGLFFRHSPRETQFKRSSLSLNLAVACFFSFLVYFSIVSDSGFTIRGKNNRAIYPLRYVDYFVYNSLLLWEVAWLGHTNNDMQRYTVIGLEALITWTQVIGAAVELKQVTWFMFIVTVMASVYQIYYVGFNCRFNAPSGLRQSLAVQVSLMALSRSMYLLAWGLTDASKVVPVDFTHLWYFILDILMRCALGMYFIVSAPPISENLRKTN
ncbi:hypothetical protein PROFUN_16623 [Planoprotostelium fungivorum]|uniref:Uncharacterized protein n=1 Tax=Planoprotostelium fungivorum TaxID=1890364 RepID=A0A2P6MQ02_9EUKA|nr:hypothetical protein PROFUN_16623 [Planoprotostelium fungivorum]